MVASALLLAGCGAHAGPPAADAPQFVVDGRDIVVPRSSPLRSRLVVAPVSAGDVVSAVGAPAIVEADPARQYRILTPLAGRVVRLLVHLGDRVRAGQPLAFVSSPDLSTAIADDERARSQLRLTEAARNRSVALKAIGAAADKEVEQTRADYAAAQAEATRAAHRLAQVSATAAIRGGGLALVAPAAGIVTDLTAAPGVFWTDPTAPLMTISDIASVWVTANVAEGDLATVRQGEAAHIALAAYPTLRLSGRVQSVAPLLDPDTRRAKVRVAVANQDGRLKPGMFASVDFAPVAAAAPVVPTTALLLKDDATTVLVETAPWRFERRRVETGTEHGTSTAIAAGLVPGQRVIVRGGVLLDD